MRVSSLHRLRAELLSKLRTGAADVLHAMLPHLQKAADGLAPPLRPWGCPLCFPGQLPLMPRPGLPVCPEDLAKDMPPVGRIYHPAALAWYRAVKRTPDRAAWPPYPAVPETVPCPLCRGDGVVWARGREPPVPLALDDLYALIPQLVSLRRRQRRPRWPSR